MVKLADEIAETLCALMDPEANTTIATRERMPRMAIDAGSMTIIIAAKLEPVKKALEIAWNDGVCPVRSYDEGEPRCQCPDCKAVSDAFALLSEEG